MEAGLKARSENDSVSSDEKQQLLAYLRKTHGEADAEPDVTALSRTDVPALIARVRTLEAALHPFAEAVDDIDHNDKDDWHTWEHPVGMAVTLGEFRAAREALKGTDTDNAKD